MPSPAYLSAQDRMDLQAMFAQAARLHQTGEIDKAISLYQDILSGHPDRAEVVHFLGLATYQKGDPEGGLALMDRALAIRADVPAFHSNRGILLRSFGRLDEAVASFNRAIDLDPHHEEALSNCGVTLMDLERADEAIAYLRRAVEVRPGFPEANTNLGNALAKTGRVEEAINVYKAAVAVNPGYINGHANLGRLYLRKSEFADCLASLKTALALSPREPQILFDLARCCEAMELFDDALKYAEQAVEISPDSPEPHAVLASVLLSRDQEDAALAAANRALDLNPTDLFVRGGLGGILLTLKQHKPAVAVMRSVVEDAPQWAEALSNLGGGLLSLGEYEEAEEILHKAIELCPDHHKIYGNLAGALQGQLKHEEALKAYAHAIEIAPDDASMHLNQSLVQLAVGDFERGWENYEWRWQTKNFLGHIRHLPQPRWDGTSLEGRSIVLTGEQGVGDEIMFAGLIPELVAAGARCLVEAHSRLVPLFRRSFPGVEIYRAQHPTHEAFMDPNIDYSSPIGSLMRFLRPSWESFRPQGRYLHPHGQLVEECRNRYDALGPGLKVGISWRSGNATNGFVRSAETALWDEIFAIPGIQFINLQYGDCTEELAAIKARTGVDVFQDNEVDPLKNMEAFAAQVEAVDLIISTDNSTVHMGGALGKPTWVILPYAPDFRWFKDREDTLWYESVRLFRQPSPRQWTPVFERIRDELATVAANGNVPLTATKDRHDTTVAVGMDNQNASGHATRPVSGKVVLLNDMLNDVQWGRSGSSRAIHQTIRALGHPLTLVPAGHIESLRGTPDCVGDLDSAEFLQRFTETNPVLMRQIRAADIVIINGAGSLCGMAPTAANLLYLAYAAKRHLGKHVEIVNHSCFPQPGGLMDDPIAWGLYKKVYQSLDFLAFREHVTCARMQQIQLPATLAFDCLPLFIADNYEWGSDRPERSLLICGTEGFDLSRIADLVGYLNAMQSDGFEVKVMIETKTQNAEYTQPFFRALRHAMPDGWTLIHPTSLEEWLDAIAASSLVVSGLIHHVIAGTSLDRPFIALTRANAMDLPALVDMLGRTTAVSLDSPSLTADLVAMSQTAITSASVADRSNLQALCELSLQNFEGLASLRTIAKSA